VEKACRKFFFVMMGMAMRVKVDLGLGSPERLQILLDVVRIGMLVDHDRHHEARVDDLAKTELLHEIRRAAEQADGGHLAIEEPFHSPEEKTVGERQLDLIGG